jgi:hypothetical protein
MQISAWWQRIKTRVLETLTIDFRRQLKESGIMANIEEIKSKLDNIRSKEMEQDGKLDQLRTTIEELRSRGGIRPEVD